MAPIIIVNEILNRENYQKIEKFAFSEGLPTCSLRDYLRAEEYGDAKSVLCFADEERFRQVGEDVIHILCMQCPVILLPASERELESMRVRRRCFCGYGSYPFSYQDFQGVLRQHIDEELWEEWTMVFGQMVIERDCRRISMNGEPLALSNYGYDIFLTLVEHLGEVVPRTLMNELLPKRKRNSTRNIDTHIKCIRKMVGSKEIIQCIRAVGYRIPTEQFYQYMKRQEKTIQVFQ